MPHLISRLFHNEDGQDLIEYALLAAFISLVAIAAITGVGTGVNNIYNDIEGQVTALTGGGS